MVLSQSTNIYSVIWFAGRKSQTKLSAFMTARVCRILADIEISTRLSIDVFASDFSEIGSHFAVRFFTAPCPYIMVHGAVIKASKIKRIAALYGQLHWWEQPPDRVLRTIVQPLRPDVSAADRSKRYATKSRRWMAASAPELQTQLD